MSAGLGGDDDTTARRFGPIVGTSQHAVAGGTGMQREHRVSVGVKIVGEGHVEVVTSTQPGGTVED